MIYSENQLRQFFVLNSTYTATPVVSNTGKSKLWYAKCIQPGGTISTDKIVVENIRDIRISQPQGQKKSTWTLVFDGTPVVGKAYILTLNFKNRLGFGDGEADYYSIVTVAKTTTVADFYTDLAANINRTFRHAYKPLTATASATNVVMEENVESYGSNTVILQRMPLAINLTVSGVDEDGNAWLDNLTQVTDGVEMLQPTLSDVNGGANAIYIADMENFYSRGRGDIYGYVGCPKGMNPMEMVTAINTTDIYYVLDIKYYSQNHGINNQNSEKELSFASTTLTDLTTLAAGLATFTTSTLTGGNTSAVGTLISTTSTSGSTTE